MRPKPRPKSKFKPKKIISSEKTKEHAQILANRVCKQYKHLKKRFARQNIDCFRLYDWDIPEVRAVVDWYAGHVVIAEYVREQTGPDWLPTMAAAVGEALELPADHVHFKHRRTKAKEGVRYTKLDSQNQRFTIQERDLKLWVNLDDFLDTGLYSDHRDTRVLVKDKVKGKDFLNLYAYTGAFTCVAAAGGARTTTTVDRSATYQKWTQDNLELNGLWGKQHTLIQSDVDTYLKQAQSEGKRFTFAFIDPPSFFQDKNTGKSFDMNRDHFVMLQNVLRVMAPKSTVIFSTNHQRFEPRLGDLSVRYLTELTPKTIPEDYRNKKVHRCWRMTTI